jgi:hypothetical protein
MKSVPLASAFVLNLFALANTLYSQNVDAAIKSYKGLATSGAKGGYLTIVRNYEFVQDHDPSTLSKIEIVERFNFRKHFCQKIITDSTTEKITSFTNRYAFKIGKQKNQADWFVETISTERSLESHKPFTPLWQIIRNAGEKKVTAQ